MKLFDYLVFFGIALSFAGYLMLLPIEIAATRGLIKSPKIEGL